MLVRVVTAPEISALPGTKVFYTAAVVAVVPLTLQQTETAVPGGKGAFGLRGQIPLPLPVTSFRS